MKNKLGNLKDFLKEMFKDMYKSIVKDTIWYKIRNVKRDDLPKKALRCLGIIVGQIIGYMIIFGVIFSIFALASSWSSLSGSFAGVAYLIFVFSCVLTVQTIVLFETLSAIFYLSNKIIKKIKKIRQRRKNN